jgi:hypothetical protein
MTERTLSHGYPCDRSHGGYPPMVGGHRSPRRAADQAGFLEARFGLSLISVVTTRIIRVLYSPISIMTVLAAFVTILAFRASLVFGFLTLIVGICFSSSALRSGGLTLLPGARRPLKPEGNEQE